MKDEPFKHKLVAVVNKNVEPGRAMNALAHMSLGLGSIAKDQKALRVQSYFDADKGEHPPISDIPFIVLKGGSNQIRNLRKTAIEEGFDFTDFTETMVHGAYIEQHQNMNNTKEEDLTYYGICLFGDVDKLTKLTKKFSLYG